MHLIKKHIPVSHRPLTLALFARRLNRAECPIPFGETVLYHRRRASSNAGLGSLI